MVYNLYLWPHYFQYQVIIFRFNYLNSDPTELYLSKFCLPELHWRNLPRQGDSPGHYRNGLPDSNCGLVLLHTLLELSPALHAQWLLRVGIRRLELRQLRSEHQRLYFPKIICLFQKQLLSLHCQLFVCFDTLEVFIIKSLKLLMVAHGSNAVGIFSKLKLPPTILPF